ncbi:peroxidase family protein [Microvirga antarctica]|uniref:peroxidase family protein n=1 Tax=Microvirga antarctica TaxID=2819233 RepID=UPI001B30FF20|nr:peroxidase family protein [Microvirga antarctica]
MSSGISANFASSLIARDPTGIGNNIANPLWGSAGDFYVRVTPDSYLDGAGQMSLTPIPRVISDQILAQPKDGFGNDVNLPNAAETNEFFQFFGQFLTHDVAEAAGSPSVDAPVNLAGLPFPFIRTPFTLVNGVRQQQTTETSFLDLSTVYGVNQTMLDLLRDDVNGVQGARLLTSGDSEDLLPTFAQVAADSGQTIDQVRTINNGLTALGGFAPTLFVTGDDRTNQSAALLTHHTLWAREHNWQVDRLAQEFPSWTQEQLFQAARAITEAEWQHIVYSEYLPKLLGAGAVGAYTGYKSDVNPSVINEWTTVAFRFGHDQSSNVLDILAENGTSNGAFTLAQSFELANASNAIRNGASLDEWVRGQLAHQTQEIDGKVVEGNRNLLFGQSNGNGTGASIDLTVLDTQRGRDHGVGDYNTLRAGLGLSTYTSFDTFAAENGVDSATLAALKLVYANDITKLDSIIGGLLERHVSGSQLGVTFTDLTSKQFENLRDGDRFYYENRLSGETSLLNEIKSTSLADIIGRTSGITYVYHDAFASHQRIGGTEGGESLNGTSKKDLMMGYGGDDAASGGNGDDDLHGGAGHDSLFGGAGSDWLDGEADDDILEGGAGADRIDGGAGNDTASYAGSTAVAIDLAAGTASSGDATGDTLTSIENLIGGSGADSLRGNGGNNSLAGGAGGDTLDGGNGNDTAVYRGSAAVFVDLAAGKASGGEATGDVLISIENIVGGDGADSLRGDAGNNHLSGGGGYDLLEGGAGADTLDGGSGIDTVTYASAKTAVYMDLMTGSASGSQTGADVLIGIENLIGGAGSDRLFGDDGVNSLTGGAGNDYLIGRGGADVMIGGTGNDIYVVDNARDIVKEIGDGGKDTVRTSVSYTLARGSEIENLKAIGTGPFRLSGNSFDNAIAGSTGDDVIGGDSGDDRLSGGAGDDRLVGGKGADRLAGGTGNDTLFGGQDRDILTGDSGRDIFVFNARPNKATNLDTITDFNVRDDSVWLDNAVFGKLGKGTEAKPVALNKAFFTVGSEAKDKNDYLIYDNKTGVLSYDADGSGAGKAIEIASLKKGLKLTYHDFFVI